MASSGKRARDKGQRGEREFAKLIQPVVTKAYRDRGAFDDEIPDIIRNLSQTRDGGYDLVGLDWLALEIKRQETYHINQWWAQTLSQTKPGQEPVLAYKKNYNPWIVRMRGALPTNGDWAVHPVTISVEAFMDFLYKRIVSELEGKL